MIITTKQIRALRIEALEAGDEAMAATCTAALKWGERSAEWRQCATVIAEAAAASGRVFDAEGNYLRNAGYDQ